MFTFETRMGIKHYVFTEKSPIYFAWLFSSLGFGLTISIRKAIRDTGEWWRAGLDTRENMLLTKRVEIALKGCFWLKSLSVRTQVVSDFRSIARLYQLRFLEFVVLAPVTVDISGLSQLEELTLGQWTESVLGLSALPNLRSVYVQKLSPKWVSTLPTSIEHISALGADLMKSNLRRLPNLTKISIAHSRYLDFGKNLGSDSVQVMLLRDVEKVNNTHLILEKFPNLKTVQLDWVATEAENELRTSVGRIMEIIAKRIGR